MATLCPTYVLCWRCSAKAVERSHDRTLQLQESMNAFE